MHFAVEAASNGEEQTSHKKGRVEPRPFESLEKPQFSGT
jgi:hypothetical protein